MGETRTADGGQARPPRGTGGGRVVVAVLAVICLVLAGGCGVLLWQHRAAADEDAARERAMAAARQTAMNLATIDHQHAQRDVDRVLAGATGDFREQFAESAPSFVSVVEGTQVTTVGQHAEAAVESWDGDRGTVLVEVASTVTNRTAPQETPRLWRMRMTMDLVDGVYRTAMLEYVA